MPKSLLPKGFEVRPGLPILLDPADLDLLRHPWHLHPEGYVCRRPDRSRVEWLHHEVAQRITSAGRFRVRFKNNCRLDLRRENLLVYPRPN